MTPKDHKMALNIGQTLFQEKMKISYKGPVDERILTVFGDYIESMGELYSVSGKKLFKIFFELAQNLSSYSSEKIALENKKKIVGAGTLILKENDDDFVLITGNPVFNEDIIPVIEKCEYINSLDRESLRQYKREERRRTPSEKGNAHIGLIQVALTSANPLDIEITPINDNTSYFSVAVKINKN
jgi:hypothetical protein